MTEREKVLYDVAKLLYAQVYTRESIESPKHAWDAAEEFYEEMVKRLGERDETQG
jgi:hypothetical protein